MALAGCVLFAGNGCEAMRLNAHAERKFRILAYAMPIPVVMVDERGFVELANRAAADLLGCEKLAGSPIDAFSADLHHLFLRDGGPGADGAKHSSRFSKRRKKRSSSGPFPSARAMRMYSISWRRDCPTRRLRRA
jgi:PAS domain-containing protein